MNPRFPNVGKQSWQRSLWAAAETIVKMAIGQGVEPEQLTEDGLYEICQTLADQDRTCRHSDSILAEFRKTIREAKLTDQFPKLAIKIKEPYRIKLEDSPDGFRKEVEALLRWKQADFAAGRPREGQHSKATAKLLEHTVTFFYGYAVNVDNRKGIVTLATLVTEELVTSYTEWSINVRRKNGRSFRGSLGLLYAALRHNPRYKDLDLSWFQPLLKSIPVDSESQVAGRKAKRMLPYETLQSVVGKIRALRPAAALKGSKFLATVVRDELLMEWLLTLVWRQRNIRECRIGGSTPNLFKGPIPRSASVARPQWVREMEQKNTEETFWQWLDGKMHEGYGTATVIPGKVARIETTEVERHQVSGLLRVVSNQIERDPLPKTVALAGVGEHAGWRLEAKVSSDGSFEFPPVIDGDYVLNTPMGSPLFVESVSLAGRSKATDVLRLRPGVQATELDVILQPTSATISGSMKSKGSDSRKPGVILQAEENRNVIVLTPDQNGKFEAVNVPPGDYRLFAWSNLMEAEYRNAAVLAQLEKRYKEIHVDNDSHISGVELEPISSGN